jgi:hypothetical protein
LRKGRWAVTTTNRPPRDEAGRLRLMTEMMFACHRQLGHDALRSREMIVGAVKRLLAGGLSRDDLIQDMNIDGRPEPCVSIEGAFKMVANEHGANLRDPHVQERYLAAVVRELDRLAPPPEGRP